MERRVKRLPRRGYPAERILETLEVLHDEDVDWRGGKVFSLVFHAGDEVGELARRAYATYMAENGLNPSAFPSLRRMETEVVAMAAHLLGGDEGAVGNMTSGGTESILMAVKAARDWARRERPRVTAPEMVLPRSAHPAFDKAAHYFGVRAVHVPVGKDYRARVRATRRAISRNTILVVGSAPQYPQGVVDPIEDLAALARSKGILCHVDACVGGMMLPFVRELGYEVPAFDLSVPGVTSISADLHKYGYTAKGASLVLYRDAELRRHQFVATTDWPGGIYVSPTMTGTRPGGAIAAAWAVMNHLGHEGYLEIARAVMRTAWHLRRGIERIDGLRVLGRPHMSVMGIGSERLDVYEVGDHLQQRGWHLDRQQSPPSLHLTVNHLHLESADRFLDDLRAAVRASQRDDRARRVDQAKKLLIHGALRVMPARVATRVTRVASRRMGIGDGGVPTRSAPMYGLMGAMPNRGDLRTIVVEMLDTMLRFDPDQEIEVLELPRDDPEPAAGGADGPEGSDGEGGAGGADGLEASDGEGGAGGADDPEGSDGEGGAGGADGETAGEGG